MFVGQSDLTHVTEQIYRWAEANDKARMEAVLTAVARELKRTREQISEGDNKLADFDVATIKRIDALADKLAVLEARLNQLESHGGGLAPGKVLVRDVVRDKDNLAIRTIERCVSEEEAARLNPRGFADALRKK